MQERHHAGYCVEMVTWLRCLQGRRSAVHEPPSQTDTPSRRLLATTPKSQLGATAQLSALRLSAVESEPSAAEEGSDTTATASNQVRALAGTTRHRSGSAAVELGGN